MPQRYAGTTPWNEENISILKRMWEGGETATNITNCLRGLGYEITRNAVIGKSHRMNFKQPPRGKSPKAVKNQPRKRIVVPPADPRAKLWTKSKTKLPTKIETKLLDPDNPGISIIELTAFTCRAIVRDGSFNKLATYCGDTVETGKSYCPAHAALFYQPPNTYRLRR